MKKVFGYLSAAIVAFGVSSQAKADLIVDAQALQQSSMIEATLTSGLNWKVGDKSNYKLSGMIINGTIKNQVREETATSFWVQQDVDMGFLGKQKLEVLYNKTTGQVEKILADGQEQQLPDAADYEIVEMKEDHIRVPAGEFDCIFAKVKDKKSGDVQDAWLNPQAVPISGTLKSIADSTLGKITQELTSFEFARR